MAAPVPVNNDCPQHRPAHQPPCAIFILLVRFPVISFVLTIIPHLAVAAVTLGLYLGTDIDVFAFDFEQLPLFLNSESSRVRNLAWRSRNEYDGHLGRMIYSKYMPWWPRGYAFDYVEMIYQHEDNVLTQTQLTNLQQIEDRLFSNKNYSEDFCQVNYDETCRKPLSLVRFFDGTFKHVDKSFEDPTFSQIANVIYKANYYNETKADLRLLVSADSFISATDVRSKIVRTRIPVGGPLTYFDGAKKEKPRYDNFLKNVFQPELIAIQVNYSDELSINYISDKLFRLDLSDQAFLDLRLAAGSLIFIFVYMLIHTESLWITLWATFSICTSFLGVNLFYRFALGYTYFGFFHLLSIFIILGIGADDIFIFYDNWRLNCTRSFPSEAHRLSATYRRAAGSMLATSLTTMAAFLVSGLSPLLAVSTFGLFSGLLVLVNYITVITFFPTVVLVYSLRILPVICHGVRQAGRCSSRLKSSAEVHDNPGFPGSGQDFSSVVQYTPDLVTMNNVTTEIPMTNTFATTRADIQEEATVSHMASAVSDQIQKCDDGDISLAQSNTGPVPQIFTQTNNSATTMDANGREYVVMTDYTGAAQRTGLWNPSANQCFCPRDRMATRQTSGNRSTREHVSKIGHSILMMYLNKFLKSVYYKMVTSLPAKIIVPLFFTGLVTLFLVYAVRLRPDERQVQMFRSSHNYGRALELRAYRFPTSDSDLTRVEMVWGLRETDMSSCNFKTSVSCKGKPVFDPNFEFGSPETQEALMGFCRRLRNLTDEEIDGLHIKRNLYTNQPEIACFIEAAQNFFRIEADKPGYKRERFYPENVTFDFPFTQDDLDILVDANAQVFPDLKKLNFTRPLEVALGYWLSRGWTHTASIDYYLYRGLVGEVILNETRAFRNQKALSYNTGIKYIAVEVNTTLYVNTLGYREGLPIYDRWEALMKDLVKDLPKSFSGGFQLTEDTWHWLRVQETLANSAVYGITIGLALALPILILTTQNLIIGFLATITIGLVTVCVVGMIPMAGWGLGVLESLNLCLVVGLSVDYVVHLAEAYHRCEHFGRTDRVRHMLETVGTAVLSGAITTSGASVFMLFAEIQFLLQFGIFMLATIGFSILFSLLGFTVLMAICGPQGNTGSLVALAHKCCSCGNKGSITMEPICPPPRESRLSKLYEPYNGTSDEAIYAGLKRPCECNGQACSLHADCDNSRRNQYNTNKDNMVNNADVHTGTL